MTVAFNEKMNHKWDMKARLQSKKNSSITPRGEQYLGSWEFNSSFSSNFQNETRDRDYRKRRTIKWECLTLASMTAAMKLRKSSGCRGYKSCVTSVHQWLTYLPTQLWFPLWWPPFCLVSRGHTHTQTVTHIIIILDNNIVYNYSRVVKYSSNTEVFAVNLNMWKIIICSKREL